MPPFHSVSSAWYLVPWLRYLLAGGLLLAVSILTLPPVLYADAMPDTSQVLYAEKDAESLRSLLNTVDADTHRTRNLLYRYRLYPLTEDASILDDLPRDLEDASAKELALLSGLWAYRAGESSAFNAIRYGRRSLNLLDKAKEKDPIDPFVLLVEGQSLLYRPSIAGSNPHMAADRFQQLRVVLETQDEAAISKEEAMIWQWVALNEADNGPEAEALHQELAAADLPPLYQQFLESPPRV